MWQHLGCDPLSRIADHDLHDRVEPAHVEMHLAAPRREFDGVDQEVPDDLLQARGVASHGSGVRVRVRVQADHLGVGCRLYGIERTREDDAQIEAADVKT